MEGGPRELGPVLAAKSIFPALAQHCVGTVHLKHKAELRFSTGDYVV